MTTTNIILPAREFYALLDAPEFRRATLLATPEAAIERPDDEGTISLVSDIAPRVGQPATVCYWSDRHAATVVAVSKTGYKVTVREDRAVRTDDNGMSDVQSYRYEPDPSGREHTYYRRASGYRDEATRLVLGARNSYHDYTF